MFNKRIKETAFMGSKYLSRLHATAIRALEATCHISAPLIVVFLLIHLSAPASATFGGSSVASQTMLLGREYYQSDHAEALLVLAPLTLHAVSGLLKRLVSPRKRPRPINHPLAITGYATMFFFLPIHFLIHREYPTIESLPISGVGPAELDYEFVKTGLKVWPGRSLLLYGGLVVSTAFHMADGLQILWTSWVKVDPRPWSSGQLSNRRYRRAAKVGVLALPSFLGLYFLFREPLTALPTLTSRYEAVFRSSFIYR